MLNAVLVMLTVTYQVKFVIIKVLTVIIVTMPGGSAGRETFFGQFIIAGGPLVWFVLLPMSVALHTDSSPYSLASVHSVSQLYCVADTVS